MNALATAPGVIATPGKYYIGAIGGAKWHITMFAHIAVAIWIQERSVIVKALRRENRRRAGLSTVSF